MRHLKHVSNAPLPAQTAGICDELGSDTQAKLCFTITFLEAFLLPIIQLKQGTDGTGGDGEGEA